MKHLICLSFGYLLLFSLHAQTDFQKYFDFSSADNLTDMILTSDNNLLLCGYSSYGILVIKTNLNGEVIWQKDFHWSKTARAYDICESETHYYYLGGIYDINDENKGLVMKLNSEGDSIVTRIFGDNTNVLALGSVGSEIIISKQLIIPQNYTETSIIRMDTLFNNAIYYSTLDMSTVWKITVVDNDWYYIGYDWWNQFTFIKKAYSYYNQYPGEEPYDLIITDNISIYYSHQCSYPDKYSITKTNGAGAILWRSSIFNINYISKALHIYKNKLITTGNINAQFYFSIIDTTDGTSDTTYLHNDFNQQFGRSIAINGSNLYIAGYLKETDSINNWDIFLNKYSLDSITTAIDNSHRIPIEFYVYPNPASHNIYIKIDNWDIPDKTKIKIIDLHGNIVFETSHLNSMNEIMADVSTWSKGIYFAIIYYQGKVISQNKFIVK